MAISLKRSADRACFALVPKAGLAVNPTEPGFVQDFDDVSIENGGGRAGKRRKRSYLGRAITAEGQPGYVHQAPASPLLRHNLTLDPVIGYLVELHDLHEMLKPLDAR
jgi:hypothetical protein